MSSTTTMMNEWHGQCASFRSVHDFLSLVFCFSLTPPLALPSLSLPLCLYFSPSHSLSPSPLLLLLQVVACQMFKWTHTERCISYLPLSHVAGQVSSVQSVSQSHLQPKHASERKTATTRPACCFGERKNNRLCTSRGHSFTPVMRCQKLGVVSCRIYYLHATQDVMVGTPTPSEPPLK